MSNFFLFLNSFSLNYSKMRVASVLLLGMVVMMMKIEDIDGKPASKHKHSAQAESEQGWKKIGNKVVREDKN